ncbi:MAG: DUF927 domain-containing protein [Stellaceae bacterium]
MTAADRYVATRDIRAAIRGHETDILDGLGIGWRAGRPHIPCPYPDHTDNNDSWRWDARRAKAWCSCTKGDGILDVLMKVEGCDFGRAKVRIAEILGRDDLIRIKGELNGQKYQATDAASLLNAPADRRDDTLPIAYLGHRLAVPLAAVPIPSTLMIGLKALGYFDPPKYGSKAKPKLVGEFPCAVFATVAANGRIHAHRIYLAANGAGKADLGSGPDGRPRNPKKSAKVLGEDNTAGRAVLWGDPGLAPHLVLTEGIETGAAVALALAAEIKAGEIAVAAAVSANGIEAFQPYSATSSVTIAADRDEAPKNGVKPGSRRGELAARTFGLKHCLQIKIAISMPGTAGESIDWLDVLVRDGAAAVRDDIFLSADAFEPTQAELAAEAQSQSRVAELEKIAAEYPLPDMDAMPLRYAHTAAGRVKVHKVSWEKNPEIGRNEQVLVPIATPFGVPARLRHIDEENAYGLRCVVQDMGDERRCVDFERGALAKMAATDIRAALFAAGLRVEADGEMIAVQSLKAADPQQEVIVVRRPGWHEIPGCPDPIFITPKGAVIGAPDRLELELAATTRMAPDVAEAGTLEGWRAATQAAFSVTGCEHWTLGVLAPFAGPIIDLVGLDTCGINESGMTSSGKTISQRLAASAWSSPDIRRPGLFQSARATDNACEAMAQRATGTVFVLDELAHVSGKVAAKMIYTIAGGIGKQRMSADASLRGSYRWATFAILSGECSLAEKVRSDGGEWLAGMAVRIVDIDVTGINRNVDAETLRHIGEIEHHYGHAGPAFVRAMIKHGLHRQAAELRDRVVKAARALAGGNTADSATVRAATPLALLMVAGEMAKTFGLVPTVIDIRQAVTWAWGRFCQSSDAAALDPETQMIGAIRGWVAERWGVTIKSVDAESGVNNRETVGWFDDSAIYIPKERIREAAGNALKQVHIGAALNRRGLLVPKSEADRYCVRWVPKVGKISAHALCRSEFGRSEHAKDPDSFTVHEGGRQ